MRVLIPGGAGYIGSVLTPYLLEHKFEVTVVDNFMYKQNSLGAVCHHPDFCIFNGDIRNQELMKQLVDWADIVIPLAALVGAPLCMKDPYTATSINHEATIALIRMIPPQKWILMPTTNSAYGTGNKNHFCTEDSPLNPISQYAKEKVKVEQVLMQHPNAISFRLATVFGMSPRMRTDLLVNDFVYRAVYEKAVLLFESHFKRNYIHVRDVCKAFLHSITNFQRMRSQIYNVGLCSANLSKKQLCEHIQKHISSFIFIEAPIGNDPDQRDYVVSNEKIKATGFKPEFSLDDGIIELIKGYTMIKNSIYANV